MHIGTIDDYFICDAAEHVLRYWRALPREDGNFCPNWLEVKTDKIPNGAGVHCFIGGYLQDGVFTIVNCGDAITEFIGTNVVGQNVLDHRNPDQAEIEKRYYRTILKQPCGGRVIRHFRDIRGNTHRFITVHLPMVDYRNEVCYLLGVAITDKPHTNDGNHLPVAVSSSQVQDITVFDIGAGLPTLG